MKKNGFTLIEVLAIIIVLSIIAVITIPIVLNVLEDSKRNTIHNSSYGYGDAVHKFSLSLLTDGIHDDGLDGSYTVSELKSMGLKVQGKEPDDGIIFYDEDGVSGCIRFDEYVSFLHNGDVVDTVKGSCPNEEIVSSGTGLYKSSAADGSLVYRGNVLNNYIALKEDGTNEVLYRIVSYEPDGTIKVVRNESIGLYARDIRTSVTEGPRKNSSNSFCNYDLDDKGEWYGCNVWGDQSSTFYNGSLMSDGFYYSYYANNSLTSLTNTLSGSVTIPSSLNTFLNSKVLNDSNSWQGLVYLDKYIDEHLFNVGGLYYHNQGYDGGVKGLAMEKQEESLLKWKGKVGLVNITDYVEASIDSRCSSVWEAYYWNGTLSSSDIPCSSDNWMNGIVGFTLTANPYNRSSVWLIGTDSRIIDIASIRERNVFPTFYLKAGISLSGTGAVDDPYRIENI